MAKYRNVTTDFSGGLVTDHILGRVDIERLQKSAKPFTNFFPTLQGPALYRDGFRHVGSADDTETFSIAMSLSDGRSYRVVVSHLKITIYNSDGLQLTQLDAPYKASELDEIRWSSETDILYLCHGRHVPRTLTVDVQYQTSVLLPSDYLTVQGGVDGLESIDGFTLLADAIYELGDDSWSLNEVDFTSHPYLTTDLSGNVLSLSNRQEYIRLESSFATDFDWIVNGTPSGDGTTAQTDWYVEYYVNNQWALGKVVNSTTDPDIPDPTGSVVYVDPVDSVVNIEDEACRLTVADRTDVRVATDSTHDYYKFESVKEDSVTVRATSLVFSPNQINSYLRAGGERLSLDTVTPLDDRTRWYKIKEHLGTSDYPVEFIRGVDADDSIEYRSGSVYRSYADDSFKVYSIGDGEAGTTTQTTAIVTSAGSRDFAFSYTFKTTFTADADTTIGNLSTQKQFDVIDCYHSSDVAPNNIPEIVENSVAYSGGATPDGNLITPSGIISVFDVVTDPEGIASHEGTLTASKTLFTTSDLGRFIFAKLGVEYVTMKVTAITNANQVTVNILSSIPKNRLTGKIENNGVFRSFRLGAWYENNYPESVAFFEQRRVYAGSYDSPNYVWMSKNEDDTDFRTAEDDGDVLDTTGISYPLSNVNATIRWLAPAKALTIGTDNGIYKLTANEYTAAISPKNIRIELEDPEGAKTPPTFVGSAVFFADLSGARLLEFVYDVNVQATNTNDITKLVYPIFLNDPIIRIEYAHTPQPRIWCLTVSGDVYCLTHHKKEDFYAWSKLEVAGEVKDICVLRKGYLDVGEDQLWITVKNGDRYDYEVMAPYYRDVTDDRDVKSGALFLDSHIRFPATGSAVSTTTTTTTTTTTPAVNSNTYTPFSGSWSFSGLSTRNEIGSDGVELVNSTGTYGTATIDLSTPIPSGTTVNITSTVLEKTGTWQWEFLTSGTFSGGLEASPDFGLGANVTGDDTVTTTAEATQIRIRAINDGTLKISNIAVTSGELTPEETTTEETTTATGVSDTLDVSARYSEGDIVRVVTDGVDRGEFTVGASGLVDVTGFPKDDHVLVGISYTGFIGLTVNTWATQMGSSYGGDSRVISVRPYVYNSVGYSIGIDDKYEYVSFNKETPEALLEEESTYLLKEDGGLLLEGIDKVDRFYTGFGKELPVRGSLFGVDKVPTIKHDRPYPLTLVSLVVKTDFNP